MATRYGIECDDGLARSHLSDVFTASNGFSKQRSWPEHLEESVDAGWRCVGCIIKERYRDAIWQYKHPDLRFSETGRKMELDIWIPSIRTAVEYQGQQHFMAVDSWGGKTALRKLRKRDAEKRMACLKCGIRLIEISYSWDGLKESVFSCIEP